MDSLVYLVLTDADIQVKFISYRIFLVEPGHIAIKFSKLSGLSNKNYKEGWHLRIPYFERPIIYNVQTKLKSIKASTANKDMQNVILNLRVLYRPR